MYTFIPDTLHYYIWHESFWFPRNLTWDSLKNVDDGVYHPQVSDMWIPLILAVFVFIFRMIFERYIAAPIGIRLGVPAPKNYRHTIDHPSLTNFYQQNSNPDDAAIQRITKQTDLSHRQIQRWFRIEKSRRSPSKLQKFSESTWRFMFYILIFSYGTYVLYDKPWYADTLHCWHGFPHHHVTNDIYWYMMIELAYYWSALFSQFRDIRRKDGLVMSVHHASTLILMVCGWINGHVRSCTLIVYVHDAVDYLMEAAKMAKYCGRENLCNVFFVIFAIVWFITRLIILPVRILYYTLFHAHLIVGHYPFYWIYNGLLLVLQVLHVIWFYMICRIAYYAVTAGSVQGDVRSETEKSISEDDGEVDRRFMQNGVKH